MCSSKVIAACIFNELQAVSLFLAFDGASTNTNSFTSGKKYRKSVNNAVFIRNESLFFVSAQIIDLRRRNWKCVKFIRSMTSLPGTRARYGVLLSAQHLLKCCELMKQCTRLITLARHYFSHGV